MNRYLFAGVAFSLFVFVGDLIAQDALRSGPPIGAPNNRRGFSPNWVTGPCADKQLCPV
jgi:hypothetical protein